MSNLCPQCGAPVPEQSNKCEYCGATVKNSATTSNKQNVQQPQIIYVQQPQDVNSERANWPIKNKLVAAILALLLGGLGIHKFYLGQSGRGVMYILFFWTYIPAILGFIEGITILCASDENFQIKYKCRIG